jgi:hypothetical protein
MQPPVATDFAHFLDHQTEKLDAGIKIGAAFFENGMRYGAAGFR